MTTVPPPYLNYTVTPFSRSVYPPPILVKHPIFRFDDADLFISINGLVFLLHWRYFKSSSYFRQVFCLETERFLPRGIIFSHPLPLDNLLESLFMTFLCLLYDQDNFEATEEEWYDLKRLCITWRFAHQTTVTIRAIQHIWEQQVPTVHRELVRNYLEQVHEEMRDLFKRQRRLEAIQVEESCDEKSKAIVDDELTY